MITPIRITTNNSLLGVGTGKDKGEEVFAAYEGQSDGENRPPAATDSD